MTVSHLKANLRSGGPSLWRPLAMASRCCSKEKVKAKDSRITNNSTVHRSKLDQCLVREFETFHLIYLFM